MDERDISGLKVLSDEASAALASPKDKREEPRTKLTQVAWDICPFAYERCDSARDPKMFDEKCSRDYTSCEIGLDFCPVINPNLIAERRARGLA